MSSPTSLEKSGKIFYIFILIVGSLISFTILFSLLAGIRINFIYSTLIDSAVKVRISVSEARRELLKNINEPHTETLQQAWGFLEIAEFNSRLLLEEKDKFGFLNLSVKSYGLRKRIQELQALLVSYKDLSYKINSETDTLNVMNLKNQWEQNFNEINLKTQQVQDELLKILNIQLKNFKLTQFGLVGLSILISFISIFIFYRYEKQGISFKRRLADASNTIENGTMKTTVAEEALLETQRRLATLVNNLPGMVYRSKKDSHYNMEYISEKCFFITGYTADELIENKFKPFSDLINAEDIVKIQKQVQEAIEAHKPFQLVYRIRTSSGFEKWVWEQGVGIYSEKEDELLALEGFITDITEQKSVQDQLALQSNALEATANGIMITDKDGKILWANNAFINLTGYSLSEIIGQNPRIFKSGEQSESFYSHMWSVILGGETWHGEIINKRKNKEIYFEDITITPVKNIAGEITNFVAIKQDITERKNSENALRESELRFRGLYENATVGIYRTTLDGQILMANPALLKILGFDSLDEIFKIQAKDVYLYPQTRDIFKQQLLMKGRVFGFESQWKKKDNSAIYIRESARLVRDENERPIYIEGIIEDITEKKKTEYEIIKAKERAEQSDKLKSEFLAQLSHEIRTPLNVILNFTNIIKEELGEKANKELQEDFDAIEVEGKRMLRTIELIVNMSQIHTGQYEYNKKKIELFPDVIAKLYNDFVPVSVKKNIQLKIINNASNTEINVDEYSVKQIFYHLIDNAIKYTHKGKVEVSVGRDSRNHLYVDVIDTGIGMSEEYLAMLFMPFTREETGYTREYEGNGLGLALAKKYCDLNKAVIKVKSIKNRGTAFRVTFLERPAFAIQRV